MIWLLGIAAFAISLVLTPCVGALATRWGIVDKVKSGRDRKVHRRTTPLLGGVAIGLSVAVLLVLILARTDLLTSGQVTVAHYVGLLIAVAIVLIGGALDDRYNLPPKLQILVPLVAAAVVVLGGVGVEKFTNPFGGVFLLSSAEWAFGSLGGHVLALSLPGDVLVFGWLVVMMLTTKLLDGLDGLATSIGSVGALMVLLLAGTAVYFQPDVQVLSVVILGALLGFLYWNAHPARIFLGEGGALLVGLLLGTLAVISGGKIATLLLVMGIPMLDVVWVMLRRYKQHGTIAHADRLHLHHRLYDLGLNQRQVVGLYAGIALLFGGLTLVLSSFAKLIALMVLAMLMALGAYLLIRFEGAGASESS